MLLAVAGIGVFIYLAARSMSGEKPTPAPAAVETQPQRSPQGAGIGSRKSRQLISSFEQDVTLEPYFPGECVFTGLGWNEVFKEKGESFSIYSRAYKPGSAINSIRVIPLGIKSKADRSIVEDLGEFLKTAFSSSVSMQVNVSIPEGCYNEERGQYDANEILTKLMQNPWVHTQTNLNVVIMKDDLYAPDLNFVFGYADYVHHISILSLSRMKAKSRVLTRKRIFKIARHEVAHMYGLVHCTSPFCIMRGVNNLEELDASTLSMCNGCASKIAWRLGDDGVARSAALKKLYLARFPGLFQ